MKNDILIDLTTDKEKVIACKPKPNFNVMVKPVVKMTAEKKEANTTPLKNYKAKH